MAKTKSAGKPSSKKESTDFAAKMQAVEAQLAGMKAVAADMKKGEIIQTLRKKLVTPVTDANDTSKPEDLKKEIKQAVAAIRLAYTKLTGKKAPGSSESTAGSSDTPDESKTKILAALADGKTLKTGKLTAILGKNSVTVGQYLKALQDAGKIEKVGIRGGWKLR